MSRSAARSTLVTIRTAAYVGVGVAAVWGMVRFLNEFGSMDPFASLRPNRGPIDFTKAIVLKDVKMRHYKGKKLVTQAQVGELTVRRDRQFFDLKAIKNGLYESDKGPVKFAAATGTWNQYRGLLTMSEQVRVATKDFDIQTPLATFDNKERKIEMPKPITGKFLGGEIRANSGMYVLNPTNDLLVKGVAWSGKAAIGLQDEDATPKKWNLQGDEVASSGDIMTYTNGEGTDGDIIVKGQKIEHNRKTDVVTVTGKVEYYSGAANMTSEKAIIYRREKRAFLTGSVVMLIKPKSERDKPPKVEEIKPFVPQLPDAVKANRPKASKTDQEKKDKEDLRDPKTIREYPMVVRSDSVEYFYRKGQRKANIEGSPQARQELPNDRWRQVWATKGFWDGEKELLTLFSAVNKVDVRMKNSIGDDLVALSFTLSTKEEDESYTGKKISGDIYNDDPDEDIGTTNQKTEAQKPPEPKKEEPPKKDTPPPTEDPGKGTGTGGDGKEKPPTTNEGTD